MNTLQRDLPRRDQILTAVLDLLATTPLERLTTRHIAQRVGVTQPAIFRHFRTREALLLAVTQEARLALSARVTQLLTLPMPPLARCQELAKLLAEFVDRHPGLPRLLFADLAFEAPELRLAVQHLVGMQHTLVQALVSEAQQNGTVRREVDPHAAAALFVSLVQGLGLRGLLHGPQELPPMVERLPPVLDLWLAALVPNGADEVVTPLTPILTRTALELDVRPILARGIDPLTDVLATLQTLASSSVLVVTAPFRPKPLEALLTARGNDVQVHAGPNGVWQLIVIVGDATPCLDLRDLEPPEPMERVLTTAVHLKPGDVLVAHVPRNPRWLLPQLTVRGLPFAVVELADGSAILRVEALT